MAEKSGALEETKKAEQDFELRVKPLPMKRQCRKRRRPHRATRTPSVSKSQKHGAADERFGASGLRKCKRRS